MHLFPCQQAQQADVLFSKVSSGGQGFLTWGASTPSVLKSISGVLGKVTYVAVKGLSKSFPLFSYCFVNASAIIAVFVLENEPSI